VAIWTAAGAAQAQQVFVIATNPEGSNLHGAGAVIARLMDDKAGLRVNVQPMSGSSVYLPLVNSGKVDFGLANVADTRTSYEGTGDFRQAYRDLRLIAAVFPLTLGVLVPGDSPVRSIRDLKGRSMPWGYSAMTTGRTLQVAALASDGLTMQDINAVPTASLFSGVDLLGEGKVDAATIAIGTAQVQRANVNLAAYGGVRYLNMTLTPEVMTRVRRILPSRPMTIQPAPHTVGVYVPTTLLAHSVFLSTRAAMPDDIVYNVAKLLHQSKEILAKGHPVFADFDPARMTEEVGVPWHLGAMRYYQEVGQWPPKKN